MTPPGLFLSDSPSVPICSHFYIVTMLEASMPPCFPDLLQAGFALVCLSSFLNFIHRPPSFCRSPLHPLPYLCGIGSLPLPFLCGICSGFLVRPISVLDLLSFWSSLSCLFLVSLVLSVPAFGPGALHQKREE